MRFAENLENEHMNNIMSILRMTAVAMLAAWFLIAPIHSLLGQGPFDWHIEQPQAIHGGIEILVAAILFFVAMSFGNPYWRFGLIGIVAWFYTRRHGVDVSILILYLYAEGIFALGWSVLRMAGLRWLPRLHNLLAAGMLGVVVWSLILWTVSALGFGSIDSIRVIALAVLGSAVVFSRHPPLAMILFRGLSAGREVLQRAAFAVAGATFLLLFAKAAVVLDYDSLWYGLQGEEVLVGEGSLYAGQGLASVAHYYPKFFEALLLPFSGLGSVSMIFGVAIFSWTMILFTCLAIMREYSVRRTLRLCGALLIATMPALSNIAVTAKGDAFSAWLLLMGVLGLARFRNGAGGIWAWIALCAIVLGVQARLANIPYAVVLMLILIYSIGRRWSVNDGFASVFNKGMWFGACTALLTAMISARSLILSGVVLVAPNQAVELQQALGLELKYPVGLLPPNEGLERLPLLSGLWGILFEPARFSHMIITWVGNFWFFLPVAVVVLGGFRLRFGELSKGWPLLVVGLSFFAVMFGYKLLVPAGDGNYFILPLACLALWGLIHANRIVPATRTFFNTLLVLFAFAGAAISLVTGSWGPGTRGFDLVMTRMPFEYAAYARSGIANADLMGVEKFFNDLPAGLRLVGLERNTDNTLYPAGWWLPLQYENLRLYAWQQPKIVASTDAFQRYLRDGGIDYLLMPKKTFDIPVDKVVRQGIERLKATGATSLAYEDTHYEVWKIRRMYTASAKLSDGGQVSISVDHDEICLNPVNGLVTIEWKSNGPQVVIEVKASADAIPSLWAEAGSSGILTTGPWMPIGGEFILKNDRGGEPIGRLNIKPECKVRSQ